MKWARQETRQFIILIVAGPRGSAEVGSLVFGPCVPHQATATARVDSGFVVAATITEGGCGYTSTPLVLIQGGGGTGATGTAVVSNGVVVQVNMTDAGFGYTSTPSVYIYSPFGPRTELVKAVRPSFSELMPGTNLSDTGFGRFGHVDESRLGLQSHHQQHAISAVFRRGQLGQALLPGAGGTVTRWQGCPGNDFPLPQPPVRPTKSNINATFFNRSPLSPPREPQNALSEFEPLARKITRTGISAFY
jgi:hypothetical protein